MQLMGVVSCARFLVAGFAFVARVVPNILKMLIENGVDRAASPWPTLGIRSCRTFCSDLA